MFAFPGKFIKKLEEAKNFKLEKMTVKQFEKFCLKNGMSQEEINRHSKISRILGSEICLFGKKIKIV